VTQRKMNRTPTHPGEILEKDIMPAMGLDFDAAAQKISLDKNRFKDFLDGNVDLTDQEAAEMEQVFQFRSSLLLNLQKNRAEFLRNSTP